MIRAHGYHSGKQFWINVYQNGQSDICWNSSLGAHFDAQRTANILGVKRLYRIHVTLK